MKARLITCLLFAFAAMPALGQSNKLVAPAGAAGNTTVLPLWNTDNGQVDALLLIEPSVMPQLPSQRIISQAGRSGASNNSLQLRAGLSLEANPGMGVLCNNGSVITSVGSMAGQCMLVNLGNQRETQIPGRTSVNGLLQLQRARTTVTGSLGAGRDTVGGNASLVGTSAADRRLLDSLLGPDTASLNTRDASLIGQVALGTQSWVSIGGTLARVRLIPTDQIRGGLPPEWETSRLSLSGGVGNFGGEITGQMIEVPGQDSRYATVGAGVTWRTPWKAKLSVGAENIVTRGKNPFGLPDTRTDSTTEEGRVPYVRYQQEL